MHAYVIARANEDWGSAGGDAAGRTSGFFAGVGRRLGRRQWLCRV